MPIPQKRDEKDDPDPVVADSDPLVAGSVWVFCARNSQREGWSLPREGRGPLFQWGMGISVGFFTETTSFLRNPGVRRSPSYMVCNGMWFDYWLRTFKMVFGPQIWNCCLIGKLSWLFSLTFVYICRNCRKEAYNCERPKKFIINKNISQIPLLIAAHYIFFFKLLKNLLLSHTLSTKYDPWVFVCYIIISLTFLLVFVCLYIYELGANISRLYLFIYLFS